MNARLDTAFESWGRFSENTGDSPSISGRLCYDPANGIELELVGYPAGATAFAQGPTPPPATLFGQLVDGTLVTLADCFITKTSLGAGAVGLPTKVRVNRVLFGRQVANLEELSVKRYSVEFSSLANWTCASPLKLNKPTTDGKSIGLDASFRCPDPIHIELPERDFDLKIAQQIRSRHEALSFEVGWCSLVTIAAHNSMALGNVTEVAWQCQNLMSLLIAKRLSVKSIAIETNDSAVEEGATQALRLLYSQRGKHDHPDVHSAQMLLPYDVIKGEFPQIVRTWFERSEQAVLATNVFFGSEQFESAVVNVKFLAIMQAAESYHRSLGTGVYMNEQEYATAISELCCHLPASISGDHRQSLKNRLKYGNEHSLRKRLTEMLDRLPENVRLRIAGNVTKFVSKVVDTRNYFTHYDHASQANAFEGMATFISSERLRILVVASLLHDLGINDENLLSVLQRSQEMQHWMSQDLSL